MPIRPEMKDKYPKDWKAIRAEILERAGNECEWIQPNGERCRVPNHAFIQWWKLGGYRVLTPGECDAASVDGEKVVMIVLTIAHVDQNPENNGTPGNRPNLMALCQRHHNRLDAPHRALGIKKRRQEKSGQQELMNPEKQRRMP